MTGGATFDTKVQFFLVKLHHICSKAMKTQTRRAYLKLWLVKLLDS